MAQTQDVDPYRFTCPNGHTSFEPTNGGIWCRRCARADAFDSDGHHDHVRDQRTGDCLDRDELRAEIPAPR